MPNFGIKMEDRKVGPSLWKLVDKETIQKEKEEAI